MVGEIGVKPPEVSLDNVRLIGEDLIISYGMLPQE